MGCSCRFYRCGAPLYDCPGGAGVPRRRRAGWDREGISEGAAVEDLGFGEVGGGCGAAEFGEARAGVARVVGDARAAGRGRIDLLEFPPQAAANGFGCDGHPSAGTHRLLAAQLRAALHATMGW